MDKTDVLIIGSGAAGLSAALYAGRYLLKTTVVRGKFGGETATAGQIWNYPGVPGVDGYELMKNFEKQAKESGTDFINGKVKGIIKKDSKFTLEIESGKNLQKISAKAIIFAQGAERRRLGLPKEDELTSKGVHFCVTCDGPLYQGKIVVMVGGGDAAIKGVLDLAKYAKKVYLIAMGEEITRPEPVNWAAVKKLGDKVEVLTGTQVKEIVGEEKLEKIILTKAHKDSAELVVDGLFVGVGVKPDVTMASSLGIKLDKYGFIDVDNMMTTNVPGTFAAGDTVNHFNSFKQTITAAALGAVAATSAYGYLRK